MQAELQNAKNEAQKCQAEQHMVVCKLTSQARLLDALEGQTRKLRADLSRSNYRYDALCAKCEVSQISLSHSIASAPH